MKGGIDYYFITKYTSFASANGTTNISPITLALSKRFHYDNQVVINEDRDIIHDNRYIK